ncbi:flagellar basal body P-ring formation chaperone FlgA [Kordiimonas marina]|uniref:flagellar basal body P-ring formation chaperone FlgA n=1 Tax=Kordiimonas marina TaxID=2872312 RepID=UPI001FF352AC|nr:flagellar basal body P-ring formation chaperone FlgA [Kordiimonas marina]MCJ9430339.1 flagellar basal body P-ring formation chaperone FlgA [Kordiimonas marina]
MPVITKAYEASLKAIRLTALVGTVLSAATAAHAATLKDQIVVEDAMVRLSDLFNDVGANGDTVVMEAPAPGKSDQLSAFELDRIAKEYKLDWKRPTLLKRITVTRDGVPFSIDDLIPSVLDAAEAQGAPSDVEVRLFGRKSGLYLPEGASLKDISFESFTLSQRKDRFSAVALIPTGNGQTTRLNIGGTLEEMRDVPMFTRIVSPGEVIRKSDLTWGKMAAARINSRTVLNMSDLVGQTVRRPERPGKLISTNDITVPIIIGKGSIITMMIRSGAMVLSTNGRALENGGTGDTIRVMNTKSKQTVDARVIKPGLAEVISSNTLNLAAR